MAELCSRLQYSWTLAHLWICRRWSVICREEDTRCGNILYSYIILVKWSSGTIAPLLFETAWIKQSSLSSCSRLHYVRCWILFRNFYKFVYFILTIARNDHIFRIKIGFHNIKYLQLDIRIESKYFNTHIKE